MTFSALGGIRWESTSMRQLIGRPSSCLEAEETEFYAFIKKVPMSQYMQILLLQHNIKNIFTYHLNYICFSINVHFRYDKLYT